MQPLDISSINQLAESLILEAESMFGPRIGDWNFLGVEINERGPCLMYYSEGDVTISLSTKVLQDEVQLVFQLAHEACHVLHPSQEYPSFTKHETTNLNEGISTYFSVYQLNKTGNAKTAIQSLMSSSINYYRAYEVINGLLQKDVLAIKKIRSIQPRIDKVTSENLVASGVTISALESDFLLKKFE